MDYLIPTTEEIVTNVAKSLAKNRLYNDSRVMLSAAIGEGHVSHDELLNSVERTFPSIWEDLCTVNPVERDRYISDAKAAIAAINLELLMAD